MNFVIPLHVYPYNIMVSAEETDAEVNEALKEFNTSLDKEQCFDGADNNAIFCFNEKKRMGIIRIQRIPDTPNLHGSLAHEIFHTVSFVMSAVGVKLLDESDEAFCYLCGYITKEIYEQFYEFK